MLGVSEAMFNLGFFILNLFLSRRNKKKRKS